MSKKNYTQLELKVQTTKQQKPVTNFFRSNHVSILTADPGCGKSFMAIHFALEQLIQKAYEKIIISKPLVEVGTSIGYLPGDKQEKIEVYLDSYNDSLTKILGEDQYRTLMNSKKIEFKPVNYTRGSNMDYSVVILDEAQSLTMHELMTFVTRLSETSKLIILGDPFQADIKKSGLMDFLEIAKDIDGISHMELGEEFQMRNQMIVQLYKNYKLWMTKNNSTK